MTALTSLYPDEAARAVRAEAALPGTYAEVAARSGLTEEQAMAALHVLRGAGRVVLDRGVFSRATPEQILLAGLGRGTPELRARVLKELPGNAVAIAAASASATGSHSPCSAVSVATRKVRAWRKAQRRAS